MAGNNRHKFDLYELIVGNGNVNQGLARLMAAIGLFIVVFGTITWAVF